MNCAFCNKKVKIGGKIGRQDTCPHCSNDLHCCKQCHHHDIGAYNECKEVMAERVVDKERSNFCDYFVQNGSKTIKRGSLRRNKKNEAIDALEALFKKK